MLFGDEQKFGIELESFRNGGDAGSTWFAHIRYWIRGDVVGDFEQPVVLSSELAELREILAWQGRRYSRELLDLPESDALHRVYETLWGRSSGGYSTLFGTSVEEYRRFWILPPHSEAFQGEKAILLSADGTEKIIWQRFVARDVRFVPLAAGTFDAALAGAVAWGIAVLSPPEHAPDSADGGSG